MSMKNATARFGIIAGLAIFGFTLAACTNPTDPETKNVVGIEVTTLPTKVQYNLNEEFDPSGMIVTAEYEDGSTEEVTGWTFFGYDKTVEAVQTVTVSYMEQSDSFEVTVGSASGIARPAASPASGEVARGTAVSLSTATAGAEIWYTIDGTVPAKDGSSSVRYQSPIVITEATVIRAIAVKDGASSAILDSSYTLTSATGAVTSVSLDKTSGFLAMSAPPAPPATEQLTATVWPSNAINKTVSWSSSNDRIATVNNSGLVTAANIDAGTATIAVTTADGNFTATYTVTVIPAVAVTGVALLQNTLQLAVGTSATLAYDVLPREATNKAVSWSSSNPSVASVTNGTVTAGAAPGQTTITVTTVPSGFTATCAVNVIIPVGVTGVALNKNATALTVGATETLVATITPSNATLKDVIWTSSAPTIASVDSNGVVTPLREGTAIITATAVAGHNFTDSCTVTVTKVPAGITIDFSATDSAPVIGNVTLSSANPTASLSISNPSQFSSIEWTYQGMHRPGSSLTVRAQDYPGPGTYFIMLDVIKDGVPYNRVITVTIN